MTYTYYSYRGFLLLAGPFFLSQMSEVVYQFIVLYTKRRLHWCVGGLACVCGCIDRSID